MGCSSASAAAGRGKVETQAGRRRKVWDVELSVVRYQMCVVVCFHLQEATVYIISKQIYISLLFEASKKWCVYNGSTVVKSAFSC